MTIEGMARGSVETLIAQPAQVSTDSKCVRSSEERSWREARTHCISLGLAVAEDLVTSCFRRRSARL